MIRVLLVLLAILVAVLAYVLGRPWLYAAAGVPLAGALVMFGRRWWAARQARERAASRSRSAQDSRDSLESLGIVDVRPQTKDSDAPTEAASDAQKGSSDDASADRTSADETRPDEAPSQKRAPSEPAAAPDAETRSDASPEAASTRSATHGGPRNDAQKGQDQDAQDQDVEQEDAEPPKAEDPSTTEQADAAPEPAAASNGTTAPADAPERDPVLAPYAEALRAALGAHTVCVLTQDDVTYDYRIRAIASRSADVRHAGAFETHSPLLTPSMLQQPVTVRPLDSPNAVSAYLGYYREPAPVDHIVLAPIPQSDAPDISFLLADATGETDLTTPHARALLKQFASTLAVVLDGRADPVPSGRNGLEDDFAGAGTTETARAPSTDGPRPRREIIAEEMEAADADDAPLALLLVHLNRAESLAREGEAVVEEAEDRFQARLRDVAASSRVVRFGELTYGVFHRADVDAVEPFAADVQEALANEDGLLEGGVSVGVAVRGERHTPESLRTDATEALREAYTTGSCVIVE